MVSLRGADGAGGSRGMHCWWFAPRFVAALLGDPCPREQPHFPMDAPLPGDQAWHWLQALTPCGSWLLPQHPAQPAGEMQRARLHFIPPIPRGFSPIRAPWKALSPPQLQPFVCSLSLTAEWMPESLLSHFLGAVRGCTGGGAVRGHSRGCRKLGSARGAQQQQQGLAGTHEAEPGIDFPLIPCNHILQRLLSYISIPHLHL